MEFRLPISTAVFLVATHLMIGFPQSSIGQEKQEAPSATSEEARPLSPSTQGEERGRAVPEKEQEFVGVSKESSIQDALSDALKQLGKAMADQKIPDNQASWRLVEITGQRGGIAGRNELRVKISATFATVGKNSNGKPAAELCSAKYKAEQVPGKVIITATGTHPTSGYRVYFEQSLLKIFPPQFSLKHVKPTGPVAQVVTPFKERTEFKARENVKQVVVHDAEGKHEVPVEQVPDTKAKE